jgi:prepilin-type N-terminal cleavage/methylation domain-containing protein
MQSRRGISLVELLIVVAIIGLLLQLMLPAVEMSREKARGTSCANNLRQLALAAHLHVETQQHFPSGGWGWRWVGEPDRGFDEKQPGGWLYNVLPYLEESELRNLGRGQSESEKRLLAKRLTEMPMPLFICPSRRIPSTYPNLSKADFFNAESAKRLAKSDYAANSGDFGCCDELRDREGPSTLKQGDEAQTEEPISPDGHEPPAQSGFLWSRIARQGTGLVYLRSHVRPAQVTDGLSHVYLIGEKYLEPAGYRTGANAGDDQSWNVGFDKDNCRWTGWDQELIPKQDTLGDANAFRFGSPHPMAMSFVFADGSVRAISYTIELVVHARLGNRLDGRVVFME